MQGFTRGDNLNKISDELLDGVIVLGYDWYMKTFWQCPATQSLINRGVYVYHVSSVLLERLRHVGSIVFGTWCSFNLCESDRVPHTAKLFDMPSEVDLAEEW